MRCTDKPGDCAIACKPEVNMRAVLIRIKRAIVKTFCFKLDVSSVR
jgi:hypothetical protein